MRIGIDVTSLAGFRGPARYTREMIKSLSEVSAPQDSFVLFSPFDLSKEGLPGNCYPRVIPFRKHVPWLNVTLPRAVRRERIEVMLFPANQFWLWPAAPTVVCLLDIAPAIQLKGCFSSSIDRIQNRIQMLTVSRVARIVVTISKFSARQILSSIPGLAGRIHVVSCGASEAFSPKYPRIEDNYILFVGGFDRRKNLERLILAYRRLLDRGRKERLILAGSAGRNKKLYWDVPALIAASRLNGWVEVKGGVDDDHLAELYSKARVLVMPSVIEGFGLPVLEAMACGCPVVASNAASIPEVGGDAAIYFDPYDIQEMAEQLERVLFSSELRREMIRRGFEQVRRFSWQRAGEQMHKILKDVAEGVA